MIPSRTTATATNNRTNSENKNNNTVNDSNKILTPTTTATTANDNASCANTKDSESNTSSNLIPSNIDEERIESEECDNKYAAKQDVKEKNQVLNSDQWKGTTLTVGDSILARLREAKLSTGKRIKVRYFPGGKTEDSQYHLIPRFKKEPNNIIICFGASDSPCKTEDFIHKELVNVKETINKFHPNCKEANNTLEKYNNILKQEERNIIFHNNISASHLHRDVLHLNLNGTIMITGNLLSRIHTFLYNVDSNKETNLRR